MFDIFAIFWSNHKLVCRPGRRPYSVGS